MPSPKARSPALRQAADPWLALACVAALCAGAARGEPVTPSRPAADGVVATASIPVGIARGIITPEQPMWMAGYGYRDHRAEGKVHDLFVKAVVLGEPAVVLVTLDLAGIDRDTTRRITDRLAERHGIARDRVAINCSHTHCGPIIGSMLATMFALPPEDIDLRSRYTRLVEDRVVDCVGQALADRKPARVSWGQGTCSVAVNRRENKEAEVPAIRAAGRPLRGPFDHDVPVLAIHDEAGHVRAAVFGYACHATVLSFYQWCGDYPGFACLEWERRHPGATACFWAGCGGDQNPLPRRTVELAEAYGARLADAVDAVLDEGALRPIVGRIETRYEELPLDLATPPDRAAWERTLADGNSFEKARARHLLALFDRDGRLDTTYPAYPVQAWRLGDGGPCWVFLGGEVVVDYALRLKAELGRETTWVAGYSNDVMAYIPSRRVLVEGGYEGAGAMLYYGLPATWAESVEEKIIDAVRRVVKPLPATGR
jgi:neutral ceramidase